MNIFDIIGPVMIGPSSSHTAGALRIGRVARKILGEMPCRAEIGLAGSFAKTGKGHGTDKALLAGILGFKLDDERLKNSLEIAKTDGLDYSFSEIPLPKNADGSEGHPNTAEITLTGSSGKKCIVIGASVGAGNIVIHQVNGMETVFTGNADTLIIAHKDMPGIIAEVSTLLSWHKVNIGAFRLSRPRKGYEAVMTIEVDGLIEKDVVKALSDLPHINSVVHLKANNND
ncbi:MAG: L-serine ammonia-lyase, iron-sulfur-dependent subunit beta [Spirochaetaceae bacterium]|nr:L-serine ammonia-lyase, iron-sulfur-dependent subunit beta [Spirochaetaceae bacterium]